MRCGSLRLSGGKSLLLGLLVVFFFCSILWPEESGTFSLGATPNIVPNCGFEEGEGDKANGWRLGYRSENGKQECIRDSGEKFSGNYSAKISCLEPGTGGTLSFHAYPRSIKGKPYNIPVEGGQEIVMTVYAKTKDFRKGGAAASGGTLVYFPEGTNDWRKFTGRRWIDEKVQFTAVYSYLYKTSEIPGTAWIDELCIWSVPVTDAAWAEKTPVLDGMVKEECWTDENKLTGFSLSEGEGAAKEQTEAWISYDNAALYLAFRCRKQKDSALRAGVKERDGDIWQDDAVEVCLDPDFSHKDYYRFAVNSRGVVYDSQNENKDWNTEWEVKTSVESSAWNVEMRIPFKAFPLGLNTPMTWGVNLIRYNTGTKETSCWSCPFGPVQNAARFGHLKKLCPDLSLYRKPEAQAMVEQMKKILSGVSTEEISGERKKLEEKVSELEKRVNSQEPVTPEGWLSIAGSLEAAEKDIRDFLKSSAKLTAYTFYKKKTGREPEYGVAVESSMRKVPRDGYPGRITDTVSISAAGNEYEGFQLVLFSFGKRLEQVHLEPTDLVNAEKGSTISVSNITWNPVGYVEIAKHHYPEPWVGLWPDPFLPSDPFTVEKEGLQPVWLNVYVPAAAPSGLYRGRVKILPGNSYPVSIDVNLRVWNFALPDVKDGSFTSTMDVGLGHLNNWYSRAGSLSGVFPLPGYADWCRFLLDHRISVLMGHLGVPYLRQGEEASGKGYFDYAEYDKLAEIIEQSAPGSISMTSHALRSLSNANLDIKHEGAVREEWVEEPGNTALRLIFPESKKWASVSCPVTGWWLARQGCGSLTFQVKVETDGATGRKIQGRFLSDEPVQSFDFNFTGDHDGWQNITVPLPGVEKLNKIKTLEVYIPHNSQDLSFQIDNICGQKKDGGKITIQDFDFGDLAELTKEACDHFKSKGWYAKGNLVPWDEGPSLLSCRPRAKKIFAAILKAVPDARILQTLPPWGPEPAEFIGQVSIWCPLTSEYDRHRSFYQKRQAEGDTIFWYTAIAPYPPASNVFIDQPAIGQRIIFWQAWQRGITGYLFWAVNYLGGCGIPAAGQPRFPDAPWQAGQTNGDGYLLYPGPDMNPLSSVRIENIRDGIEDYEYLAILKEMTEKAKFEKDSPLPAESAEALLVDSKISWSLSVFTDDPEVILEKREKVALLIERLTSLEDSAAMK